MTIREETAAARQGRARVARILESSPGTVGRWTEPDAPQVRLVPTVRTPRLGGLQGLPACSETRLPVVSEPVVFHADLP